MKIAMISFYLPTGSKIGVGYQAHYMANRLVKRGHLVTMFSPCERPSDALYDLEHVPVGTRLCTFRFAWNLRKMNFSGFDVLHAHGDDYCLWFRKKPVHIRTMHGSCLIEAIHIPGLKRKLRMLLLGVSELLATVVADRTVCISENTRRVYPWVRDVIKDGVDLSRFRPGEQKESDPTILFVGTYNFRKRGRLLMDVFRKEIQPALPNARLWMVCNDAPDAPGVTVFGHVPLERLCELYRRATIFCLPSSYEGFGVPYIEAMASGTPVVATPNVGAREVLGDGAHGRIVPDSELGQTIIELLNDQTEQRRLREAGLVTARGFSWDRIISAYEALYDEIARQCRRRRSPRGRLDGAVQE